MRMLNGRYRLDHRIAIKQYFEEVPGRRPRGVLDRAVAVKVMTSSLDRGSRRLTPAAPEPTDHLSGGRRIEAPAAAALTHPNIAEVYDFGTCPSPAGIAIRYIVMELAKGELFAPAPARRPAGLADRRAGVRRGVRALAAAHMRGVVHRDIKPANVMLTPTAPRCSTSGSRSWRRPRPPAQRQRGRHARVHGAGAVRRRARRAGDRHVRGGRTALPVPGRPAAVAGAGRPAAAGGAGGVRHHPYRGDPRPAGRGGQEDCPRPPSTPTAAAADQLPGGVAAGRGGGRGPSTCRRSATPAPDEQGPAAPWTRASPRPPPDHGRTPAGEGADRPRGSSTVEGLRPEPPWRPHRA